VNAHQLRVLSLGETSVTHDGLQAIADGCPLLEEFPACSFEAGPKVESIARSCLRLRAIEVAFDDVYAEAILTLAECCPLLNDVTLEGEAIGDEEVTALARGCPALTRLDTTDTSVTIDGLRVIREYCQKLEMVHLSHYMLCSGGDKYDSSFFPRRVTAHIWGY
jgi:hypothetical protein